MNATEKNAAIMRLLRERHKEDIVCAEAQISQVTNQRIDFVAIPRSWSKPAVIVYEVKVSRADFLADHKWPNYLPMCNRFVFITAHGVATRDEIPAEAGWMELSKEGRMIITRKKAPHRPMDAVKEAYLYKRLLMRGGYGGETGKEFWTEWLNEKEEKRLLGKVVSKSIQHTVQVQIHEVQKENAALKRANEANDDIRKMLVEIGVMTPAEYLKQRSTYVGRRSLEQGLKPALTAKEVSKLLPAIEAGARDLRNLLRDLQPLSVALSEIPKEVAAELERQKAAEPPEE